MRVVVFLCVCVSAVLCQDLNVMAAMPKYDSRYDYLDVDAIFTNKRLVRNYVDCLVNSNRCTPEGKALKRLLPEALRTKCVRCTERQKRIAVKIIKRLKNEYPNEWAKLSVRWDPTGDFTRYFEEFLAKELFNTIPGSGVNVVPLSSAGQPALAPRPTPEPVPAPVPSVSTPPMILNRFGDDGELMMGNPSSTGGTTRPPVPPTTTRTTTQREMVQTRATPAMVFPKTTELPLPYSTAITLIDQIGYKIIRTTEIVTDLLRNTVRVVVGFFCFNQIDAANS